MNILRVDFEFLLVIFVFFALIIIIITDSIRFIIPEYATITIIVAGFCRIYWENKAAIIDLLLGSLLGFVLLWGVGAAYRYLHSKEGIGRGDVKLAAAVGLWCGLSGISVVILAAALTALAVSTVRLATGRPIWFRTNPYGLDRALPFGVFIAAATILFLVGGLDPLLSVPRYNP